MLLGAVAAWPITAWGEQMVGKVAHIAVFAPQGRATADPRQMESFKAGLVENGLIEGQNITLDVVWAEGSIERTRQLPAELAHRNLDVIVTSGPQPVRELLATGMKTPIVFAILNDPIGDGFVRSLAHPGGNVTGLSNQGTDIESKRVEILKDAVPTLNKVMILHDPSMGGLARTGVQAAVQAFGFEFVVVDLTESDKLGEAFASAADQGVNGLVATASPLLNFQRKQLIALATQYRLPSVWEASYFVRDGGFLSYGPNYQEMYRRSAIYVAKILGGQSPADLPVEQPVKFEMAVNMITARALGLAVPPALLSRADEVIE
jgi:putative tryptophan/tyrosine transport system substrate-binding protein